MSVPEKFLQKGVREPLLCDACEQLLSAYERYVSRVFAGRSNVEAKQDGGLIHLRGIDYTKFKLFALSILWRASVSSLDMFNQVELGRHGPILVSMIREGNAGSQIEVRSTARAAGSFCRP